MDLTSEGPGGTAGPEVAIINAVGFNLYAPAANFTITASPSSETAYRERLGGVILILKSVQGFSGNVTLSCAGGPAGTKCADVLQTVRVKGTAYAVSGVVFPKNTRDGSYNVTFTGVSGSLRNSTTVKFTVK